MVDAREEKFEIVMVDDVVALFTNARVDRASATERNGGMQQTQIQKQQLEKAASEL